MATSRFLETHQLIAGFVPVDMQTAANNGDWVSLVNYNRVVCVLFKAAGTAGDDPIFTLQQAQDAGGTGAANLNFTTIYKKVGVQTGINGWTVVTQAAGNTYTDTDSAEAQAIIAVEIDAPMLADGFTHVRLTIPDTGGNAQLGCAFYLMSEPRSAGKVMPSAIA